MAGASYSGDLPYLVQRLVAEESQKLSTYISQAQLHFAERLLQHQSALCCCHATPPSNTEDSKDACRQTVSDLTMDMHGLTWGKVLQPSFDASLAEDPQYLDEDEETFCISGASPQQPDEETFSISADPGNGHSDQQCLELETSLANSSAASPEQRPAGSETTTSLARLDTNLPGSAVVIKIRSVNKDADVPPLKRLVTSPVFEVAFAALIFVNAVFMAFEQQYLGIGIGYDLEAGDFRRGSEETWPNAEPVFLIGETFFGIVFTVEVLVKLAVLRAEFCRSAWNAYDLVIIVCWLMQNMEMLDIAMPPLVVRLARLGRLLRLLRFAKTFQIFDVLRLLVRSMAACLTALMWSAMFLLLVMLGTAILMVYMLQEECQNESLPLEKRQELYTYFGTFTRGFFSLYELTMGNWVPISRVVIEHVSEWWMLFFIFYRTIVGFACLKVVTAIFNAETFRVTQIDDDVMLMHKERQVAIHTQRMQQLLLEGDESLDGELNIEEFRSLMYDKGVQKWLSAQEIELKDVEVAFEMIDSDSNGRVSAEELVRGLARLKGSARSVDVLTMMQSLRRIEDLVGKMDDCVALPAEAPALSL
eukprot:TRINITY_DN7007_c0_g1_i1.p1 TRINITY_DN7007_c0_g1~~TRINITY_DN7007_c0_g1_i1.p1  ORF type:complete len:590 (-),score=105.01 TRINITY_DN7007_c0_g1_i1:249-2018(-)